MQALHTRLPRQPICVDLKVLGHIAKQQIFIKLYFLDPKKILAVERTKRPCKRFLAGYCRFQLFCNFRHYSDKQMKQLEKIGAS